MLIGNLKGGVRFQVTNDEEVFAAEYAEICDSAWREDDNVSEAPG